MDSGADAATDDRLVQALERLTRIYGSIADLHREAIQVRTRLRDLDINVEALNMLASARSKDEKGDGELVLTDLFRYARRTGMQVEAQEYLAPPLVLHEVRVPEPESESRVENSEGPAPKGLLKLLTQVAVAMAVTSGLFVLIH